MSFHVGQKVVCVDVSIFMVGLIPASRWLSKNTVYTIRRIGESPFVPFRKHGPVVWLEEIVRDTDPNWPDFPFSAFRFRPLIERKTDISVFQQMLNPSDKKQKEDVR